MEDDDDEDMKETEKRDGEREEGRERERQRETPNTDALAQTTLKITIGCAEVQAGAFRALAGSAPTKNSFHG